MAFNGLKSQNMAERPLDRSLDQLKWTHSHPGGTPGGSSKTWRELWRPPGIPGSRRQLPMCSAGPAPQRAHRAALDRAACAAGMDSLCGLPDAAKCADLADAAFTSIPAASEAAEGARLAWVDRHASVPAQAPPPTATDGHAPDAPANISRRLRLSQARAPPPLPGLGKPSAPSPLGSAAPEPEPESQLSVRAAGQHPQCAALEEHLASAHVGKSAV